MWKRVCAECKIELQNPNRLPSVPDILLDKQLSCLVPTRFIQTKKTLDLGCLFSFCKNWQRINKTNICYSIILIRDQKSERVPILLSQLLKSLVIPIVDSSHYQGFPITKHKTQHGTHLSHTYKPSVCTVKRSLANENLNRRSYNSNVVHTL